MNKKWKNNSQKGQSNQNNTNICKTIELIINIGFIKANGIDNKNSKKHNSCNLR